MPWTDADLFALTRDTRPWGNSIERESPIGDFFDSRPHLLQLYSIAKSVNWMDPTWPAPVVPPRCVEIGVREGVTTMALLHAMRETGGQLISLECDPDAAAMATRFVEQAERQAWWRLVVERSERFAADCPTPIDLLWIDGDHSEEQVRMDVAGYAPKVRVNGFIAFHDYFSDPGCLAAPVSGGFPSGVSVVVEELRATGNYEVIVYPWAFGLAVCRRLR